MKIVAICLFWIINLGAMCQEKVLLPDVRKKVIPIEYFDGQLILSRGNMLFDDPNEYGYLSRNLIKYKIFAENKKGRVYYFLDSYFFHDTASYNIAGYLLEDKLRQRSLYVDRESILLKDNVTGKLLVEMIKVCGMDVFVYSWRCGYLAEYYDFCTGSFYFYKRSPILGDRKMKIDVTSGKIINTK